MQYAKIATRSLIVAFATTVSAIAAAAQTAPDQPDALDLLKSVELAYGAMNTYSAKMTRTMDMSGSGSQGNFEEPISVIADSTGKFRVETKGMMGMTMIYDGTAEWMYMSQANAYSKLPSNKASAYAQAGAGVSGGANALAAYKDVSKGVKEAKILRSEKVHVNDADVDCWVVSLEYGNWGNEVTAGAQAAGFSPKDFTHSKILWVDKNRYFVYREDSTTKLTMPNANTPTNVKQSSKVESFTVNDPVSPDVFTFTPPPGAKEIDTSKYMPKAAEAPKAQN